MKIIKNILWAITFSAAFISCEKKLTDLQPIDLILQEKAFLSINDLTTGVNGVYGTWQARRSVYISSIISDEARLGTGSEYRNVGNILFNWQFTADSQDWRDGETGGVWTNLYAVIDRSNRILEFIDGVPVTSAADSTLKVQYKGEMLAARAMAHLELLRCYSATAEYSPGAKGVVLQTSYVKIPTQYRPARNTQKEVIDGIVADLAAAKPLIPTSFKDIGRITRNAVAGAQARVALHIKDWQGVIDRASEVIPLQPLNGTSNYFTLWASRTLPADQSTEVIWKLNISAANSGNTVGSLWQDLNGAQQAAPAAKLMNAFNPSPGNDVRFGIFFRTVPRPLISKYGVIPPSNENFLYDIKMMRTSELVLARAEAYAELNDLTNANNDLRSLRMNRIIGYVHVPITDKATLIDQILRERYKELCYEGQRYFDLRRRSIPITRDPSDIGGISSSQTLPVTDIHYLLPIPFQEVQANPNIGQNPGF